MIIKNGQLHVMETKERGFQVVWQFTGRPVGDDEIKGGYVVLVDKLVSQEAYDFLRRMNNS